MTGILGHRGRGEKNGFAVFLLHFPKNKQTCHSERSEESVVSFILFWKDIQYFND
jgi:hypothetical protein